LFQNKDTKLSDNQRKSVELEYLAVIMYITRKAYLEHGVPDGCINSFSRADVFIRLTANGGIQRVADFKSIGKNRVLGITYFKNEDEFFDKRDKLIKIFDNRFDEYSKAFISCANHSNPAWCFALVVVKNMFSGILSETDIRGLAWFVMELGFMFQETATAIGTMIDRMRMKYPSIFQPALWS
jgi:hypothetical protein